MKGCLSCLADCLLFGLFQCIETLNCPCLTDEQMRELFKIFNDQFEKHFEKSTERDEKRRDEDYDEVGVTVGPAEAAAVLIPGGRDRVTLCYWCCAHQLFRRMT